MPIRQQSPQALYHALPQSPHAELESELELDQNDVSCPLPSHPPQTFVDSPVWWVHFVLGCSVLLPWNVLITAIPYFNSRLAGSSMQPAFSSYLSSSFTIANFIFLGHATAISKNTIPSRQARITIFLLAVLSFLLTLSTFFEISPGVFATFILINGAAQATAGAYLQTSIIAVASLFGPRAVQAIMAGKAAVAVLVSGVQVLSSATSVWHNPDQYMSGSSAEERSAFIFFSMSTIFLLASAGVHYWLVSMPIYKIVAASLEQDVKHIRQGGVLGSSSSSLSGSPSDSISSTLHIAKVNISYEVAVAYVFIVTLAVFPPITSSVQPTNSQIHPLLFSAIHFLMFNVGDFFGRYLCSFPCLLIWSSKRLLVLSGARSLFIPLFLMCNIQRSTSTVPHDPIINSDALFMSILFLFGCSNGYVASLCMMFVSSMEHNPNLKSRVEDVDVAATVASFCLFGGLAVGSMCSFAVSAAICGCNPFLQ